MSEGAVPGARGRVARLRRALAPPGPDVVPEAEPASSRHDRIVDAGAFLLCAFAGVILWGTTIEAAEPLTPREEMLFVLDAGVGLVACGALWWRRRWPAALAVLAGALGAWSAAASPAGLVLLWSAVVRVRPATTLAVLPVSVVAAVTYPRVHPDADLPYAWDAVLGVAIVLVVVSTALYTRGRRQVAALLLARARSVEADRERQLDQARRLERARIAREMHDVLGHRLSLVSMHAGALEYRPDAPPADLAHAAGVVRRTAHEALQDLREVVCLLREAPEPARTRPQPTLGDLSDLLAEHRAAGLLVQVDQGGVDPAAVPPATGRAAFRILQEGLTNVRKHAPGVTAVLELRGAPGGELALELRNPVRPGPPATDIPGGGAGLAGLVERAVLAGGRLEYGPVPPGAFRLRATLPWPA